MQTLVDALRKNLSRAEKLPKSDRALPIVLSGGTAKPKGFKEMFERNLKGASLPVEISGVRMASDPAHGHRAGRPDRRAVREVGDAATVRPGPPPGRTSRRPPDRTPASGCYTGPFPCPSRRHAPPRSCPDPRVARGGRARPGRARVVRPLRRRAEGHARRPLRRRPGQPAAGHRREAALRAPGADLRAASSWTTCPTTSRASACCGWAKNAEAVDAFNAEEKQGAINGNATLQADLVKLRGEASMKVRADAEAAENVAPRAGGRRAGPAPAPGGRGAATARASWTRR